MSQLRYCCFDNEDAIDCNTLMDFYRDDQLKYVKMMLDGSYKGGYGKRRDWGKRGMIPRYRNITKSVVDKSAMVFNSPPVFETYNSNKTMIDNSTFDTIMQNADYLPFWQNAASMVRLLKSVVIYNQKYIPLGSVTENQIYRFNPFNGESLMQTVTHHGNSEVIMDPSGRFIIEYAYLMNLDNEYYDADLKESDQAKQYCVVTPNEIETWIFKDDKDILVDVIPNIEGFVPAFFHHDVRKPIYGYWNKPGIDLGQLNEILNLHITDTEFAVTWSKQKTLFTNGTFGEGNASQQMIPAALPGHTDPGALYNDLQGFSNSGDSPVIGLGAIVQVTSDDSGRDPMIKFDGPTSDLDKLHQVISALSEDVANDWDVNVRIEGRGSANSGFQLVVESMDGLNLRAKQIQFFQASFRIMYEILQRMYPELPAGNLYVSFAPPSLPVNEKERDANWVSRISTNRASVIDYLMEENDLTEEEAVEKATKIKAYNDMFSVTVAPTINKVTTPADTNGNDNQPIID